MIYMSMELIIIVISLLLDVGINALLMSLGIFTSSLLILMATYIQCLILDS